MTYEQFSEGFYSNRSLLSTQKSLLIKVEKSHGR